MILGIGTDLVDVARIAAVLTRHGDRFIRRVFAPAERVYDATHESAPSYYAKRWAAKEAAAKALHLGVDGGVYLKDMIVEKTATGAPVLRVCAGAEKRACLLNGGVLPRFHLSLTDDGGYALAFVVIEGLESAGKAANMGSP